MKKKIIITVILISVFSLYGCSASQIEKEPVVITNSQKEQGTEISVTPTGVVTNEGSSENSSSNSTVDNSGIAQDDTKGAPSEDISVIPIGQSSEKSFPAKITIEGTEGTINCKRYYSNIGYTMDYDIDRFDVGTGYIMENDNLINVDVFSGKSTNPELYPPVYLQISDIGFDRSITDANIFNYMAVYDNGGNILGVVKNPVEHLYSQNNNKNNNISTAIEDYIPFECFPKTVDTVQIGNYQAYHYIISHGTEWNSEITEYYYIDTKGTSPTQSGIFKVQLQYYNGAAEGYGARLKAMLDTFAMVEFQEADPTN